MPLLQPRVDVSDKVLITHRGCMDGAGSAIMFIIAGGKRENIRFVDPGHGVQQLLEKEEPDLFLSDRFLLFADIGTTPEFANRLEKRGQCFLIDHHKSSLNLASRDWCLIDMKECGSMLMYRWLFQETPWSADKAEVFRFAYLMNDRDMWLRREEESDELILYMNFWGADHFIDKFSSCMGVVNWSMDELALLVRLKEQRDEYARARSENVVIVEVDGYTIGYTACGVHQSLVLHEVLDKNPDVDIAAGVNFERGRVSLRARKGGTDVSKFAERYGGGGHAAAAAHRMDPDTLLEILGMLH